MRVIGPPGQGRRGEAVLAAPPQYTTVRTPRRVPQSAAWSTRSGGERRSATSGAGALCVQPIGVA